MIPAQARRLIACLAGALLGQVAHAAGSDCPTHGDIPSGAVRVAFTGDIVLGNSFLVNDIPESWDDRYFAAVRPVLKRADLVVGNLEGALTQFDKTRKTPGSGRQFAFRMPPRYAALLAKEGFAVVNVANNHALDFGDQGFQDTLQHVRRAGMTATGQYGTVPVVKAGNLRVAVIGFMYTPAAGTLFNSIFDTAGGAALVRRARQEADTVVVTFHGGAEGTPAIWHEARDEQFLGENRGNTVAFARAMIDAGADLVVGHGPHVLRSAECYAGRPIVYSLGNFVGVGGLSIKQMAAVSALLEVALDDSGKVLKVDVVPVLFDEGKVPLPDVRGFGAHLINRLGRQARFKGNFLEFAAPAETRAAFDAWFAENAPKE